MINTIFTEHNLLNRIINTEKEIWGQPRLWQKVFEQALQENESLLLFIKNALSNENLNIVLTGAGTSAFIGLSLIGTYKRNLKKQTTAVATTDLVTHPLDFLNPDVPVLLISFARSGNSPESVAAVQMADQICSNISHLIITCDPEGALAKYVTNSSKFVFILPIEANDKSLAMTGSYSGMLLAGLLIARINEIDTLKMQVQTLQKYGLKLLNKATEFRQIAEKDFERAVFLGSGPLFGTAIESHLKVQELTDGKVICKNDTFLGFRHGPKVVIDQKTLVFLLLSNQEYVQDYELDLLNELRAGQKPLFISGLSETASLKADLDDFFILSETGIQLDEEFLAVCYVLPAQMIGFFKSLQLGLDPDSPSASRAISRVVKGVVIYPYSNNK